MTDVTENNPTPRRIEQLIEIRDSFTRTNARFELALRGVSDLRDERNALSREVAALQERLEAAERALAAVDATEITDGLKWETVVTSFNGNEDIAGRFMQGVIEHSRATFTENFRRAEAAERLNGELVEALRMLMEAAEAAARHHREEASGHEFPALESQITRARALLERITH